MLKFFRDEVSLFYTPSRTDPSGNLFLWFTNDKMFLAIQCLEAAGYTLVGIDSWLKARKDGGHFDMSRYRGDCEHFLIGKKKLNGVPSHFHAARGLLAPPATSTHSSKPDQFYTRYLPEYAKKIANYGKPWGKVKKLDIFRRDIQVGFLCLGNQYHGTNPNVVMDLMQAKSDIDDCNAKDARRRVVQTTAKIARIVSTNKTVSSKKRTRSEADDDQVNGDFGVGDKIRVAGIDGRRKVYWPATVVERSADKVKVQWKNHNYAEWVSTEAVSIL